VAQQVAYPAARLVHQDQLRQGQAAGQQVTVHEGLHGGGAVAAVLALHVEAEVGPAAPLFQQPPQPFGIEAPVDQQTTPGEGGEEGVQGMAAAEYHGSSR